MTKYLLTQWQAIELFCKVVCKYENLKDQDSFEKKQPPNNPIKIEDFRSNDFLLQTLRRYENPAHFRDFGEIYMKKIAEKAGISRYYPKTLYELSREIRYSIPIVRTIDEISLLLIFIDENPRRIPYRVLEAWSPSDKQRMFEGTRWWLYHYEEYIDPFTSKPQPGISRAIVSMKEFAKLTIDNIDASGGEPGRKEKYKGQYSIYKGSKGEYLLLECWLADSHEKDLHILIYIGNDELKSGEIALGQYHNVNNTIYSGTVIMEKVRQQGSLKPAFFKNRDKSVPTVYWDFFEDKHKNRIRVKSGIKLKETLKTWIEEKRYQAQRRKKENH